MSARLVHSPVGFCCCERSEGRQISLQRNIRGCPAERKVLRLQGIPGYVHSDTAEKELYYLLHKPCSIRYCFDWTRAEDSLTSATTGQSRDPAIFR